MTRPSRSYSSAWPPRSSSWAFAESSPASVSPDDARAIAAGFPRLDAEELTETQPGQVILELTNILCGAVMSNLWPESSLSLDPPRPAVSEEIPPGFLHRCFQLADGPVAISIRV